MKPRFEKTAKTTLCGAHVRLRFTFEIENCENNFDLCKSTGISKNVCFSGRVI